MPHDAEYFRERRKAQGAIPRGDEFLHSARVVERGRQMRIMEQLPVEEWPNDLYQDAIAATRRRRVACVR